MSGVDGVRRALLASAGVLAAGAAWLPRVARAGSGPPATTPGKPGDFDFLAGNWTIKHRMRKGKVWDEFDGEATCWSLLKGVGSIEELRIPARDFSGVGIRLLDVEKKLWSDFWVNAKSGVLAPPGLTGSFENGVGTFIAEDTDGGKRMLYRGVWDEIGPKGHRWHQAFSEDGGKTWTQTWVMHWTRRTG